MTADTARELTVECLRMTADPGGSAAYLHETLYPLIRTHAIRGFTNLLIVNGPCGPGVWQRLRADGFRVEHCSGGRTVIDWSKQITYSSSS